MSRWDEYGDSADKINTTKLAQVRANMAAKAIGGGNG